MSTNLESVARAGVAFGRFVAGGSPADLDASVAAVLTIREPTPDRAALAAALVTAIVRMTPAASVRHVEHLAELIRLADEDPPAGAQWTSVRAAAGAFAIMHEVGERNRDPRQALDALAGLEATLADGDPTAAVIDLAREAARLVGAVQDEDHAPRDVVATVRRLRDQHGLDHPLLDQLTEMMAAAEQLTVPGERTPESFGRLLAAVQALPDSDLRRTLDDSLAPVAALRPDLVGGPATAPGVAPDLATLRAVADRYGAGGQRTLTLLGAAMGELANSADVPFERVESAVHSVRRVLAETPDGSQLRPFVIQSLGMALMRRYELSRDPADLAEMTEAFATARELDPTPGSKVWQMASQLQGLVKYHTGDRVAARRLMIESLRGFAWGVLLQADVAGATLAARDAASEAMDAALHCLRDDAVDEAVMALDAGRGLTLFAATQIRDVATRLDGLEEQQLADRWRAATRPGAGPVPPELRKDVVVALSAADSGRVLDPPTVDEIQSALSTLDSDALVYLVPARGIMPGVAAVVPSSGPPTWMILPELMLGGGRQLDKYLQLSALRGDPARDVSPTKDADTFRARLDSLCEWSWRAVMGPVLDLVGRHAPAPAGRVQRIVLVPMGDLALVPWHAAREPVDGRAYAVQRCSFSYAVSARMLCDSAHRPPVPVSSLGMILGDPDTTDPANGHRAPALPAARAEAFAVRQAFYRAARYVGQRPDGSASPSGPGDRDAVIAWLTSHQPGAGAVLHLACHGVTRADADDGSSYLLLAGGNRLTAEELVGLLADRPHRSIGLVVLAACRSGVSTRGYDEAYSLGTTFLAAGVRSVLSTQWSIPDGATSLLMFMFHHFLRAEGHPPRDALRRAQLWMLDPRRCPPDSMPPQLRGQLDDTEPADPTTWAAFVHSGH